MCDPAPSPVTQAFTISWGVFATRHLRPSPLRNPSVHSQASRFPKSGQALLTVPSSFNLISPHFKPVTPSVNFPSWVYALLARVSYRKERLQEKRGFHQNPERAE